MDAVTRLFLAGYATIAAGLLTIPAVIALGRVALALHWMDGEDATPGLGIVFFLVLFGVLLIGACLLVAGSAVEIRRLVRRRGPVSFGRIIVALLSLGSAAGTMWWIYHLSTT
jgi:hypothetical protein